MLAVSLAAAGSAYAAEPQTPDPAPSSKPNLGMADKSLIDMEHSDTFMDVSEAIRSRQYVQRTILSTVIRATTKFAMNRFYLNHLMGFSSVMQANPIAKYSTGLQGLAAGWVSSGGHAFETGVEVSAVSNVYVGYRYFHQLENFSLWPILGFGVGKEMPALRISEPPGGGSPLLASKPLIYMVVGLLIPLVDVGLRAEVRFSVQGAQRVIMTQGLGLVVFL